MEESCSVPVFLQVRRVGRDVEPRHRRNAGQPDGHRGLRAGRGQKVHRLPLQRQDGRLRPDSRAPLAGIASQRRVLVS